MLRFCIKIYTCKCIYKYICELIHKLYTAWSDEWWYTKQMSICKSRCMYQISIYIYIHTNIYTCIIYQISYRTNVIIYSYTTKRIFSWYLPSTFTSNRNKVTASGARPLQGQKWRKHGGSKAWQRHVRSCYIPLRWNNPRK